jgi:radical SAM superfamily enzyme YgiQ (UPF0313 family)
MILLISPPFSRLLGKRDDSVPNGLAWLSASLQAEGVASVIYHPDARPRRREADSYQETLDRHQQYQEVIGNPEHEIWSEVRAVLEEVRPEVVGISVMSAKEGSARRVSEIAKLVDRSCRVVWGGQHPTIMPERCLQVPEVDLIVRGEGEGSFLQLLSCLRSGQDPAAVAGLGLRLPDGGVRLTGPPRHPDFSLLPFPKKDTLLYPEWFGRNELGGITATRGCPFPCGFCSASQVVGKKIRPRPVTVVVDEIEYLKSTFGTTIFHFHDDTFSANKEYTQALCEELLRRRVRISWSCTTRITSLTVELLRLMERAGCYYTSLGVESGSNAVLQQIQKSITREVIIDRIAELKRTHVAWTVFIMAGFPDEKAEDVAQTTALLRHIRPERIVLSFFTPYPGTPLFQRCVELGLASPEMDWSRYNHQSPENSFSLAAGTPAYDREIATLLATVDEINAAPSTTLRRVLRTLPLVARRPSLAADKLRRSLARFA